ncbi:MAG: hypothetical protein MZW92_29995 [Comamonadaceae bacterium]|nr:hypothetical protein [Comamonadaceae bacterium]
MPPSTPAESPRCCPVSLTQRQHGGRRRQAGGFRTRLAHAGDGIVDVEAAGDEQHRQREGADQRELARQGPTVE